MNRKRNSRLRNRDIEAKYYLDWAANSLESLEFEPSTPKWHESSEILQELRHVMERLRYLESLILEERVRDIKKKYGWD